MTKKQELKQYTAIARIYDNVGNILDIMDHIIIAKSEDAAYDEAMEHFNAEITDTWGDNDGLGYNYDLEITP